MFKRIVVFIVGVIVITLGWLFLAGSTDMLNSMDVFFITTLGIAFFARGGYMIYKSIT